MGRKTDQIKGRIKEAAGALTDNDSLKREGKLDQVVGKVKETAEKAVDKMKDEIPRSGLAITHFTEPSPSNPSIKP